MLEERLRAARHKDREPAVGSSGFLSPLHLGIIPYLMQLTMNTGEMVRRPLFGLHCRKIVTTIKDRCSGLLFYFPFSRLRIFPKLHNGLGNTAIPSSDRFV